MVAGAPHRGADELAALEAVAVGLDDAEHLVAEHEHVGLVRGDPEQAFRDLAIRAAHADLEHAHEDTVAGRLANVGDACRVRDPRLADERLHAAVMPPSIVRIVPVTNSAVAR